MSDPELMAMTIEERNAWLDDYWADFGNDEYDPDAAYERHLEFDDRYVGSPEEALDRYLESWAA